MEKTRPETYRSKAVGEGGRRVFGSREVVTLCRRNRRTCSSSLNRLNVVHSLLDISRPQTSLDFSEGKSRRKVLVDLCFLSGRLFCDPKNATGSRRGARTTKGESVATVSPWRNRFFCRRHSGLIFLSLFLPNSFFSFYKMGSV